MSKQKVNQEQIRKIQKSNGSYLISLPMGAMRELGWREGQKIVVQKRDEGFIIINWKKKH